MAIDIDALGEDELRGLHRRIAERLRMMQQLRAHRAMLAFSIGDRVEFAADGRRVVGIITRYNKQTVSILAENGQSWTVSPGLVTKVVTRDAEWRPADTEVTPAPSTGAGHRAAGLLADSSGHAVRQGQPITR